MTKLDAVNYYGSATKLALALGISKGAVSQWAEYPPAGKQAEIELLTQGELKREGSHAKSKAA